MITEINVSCRTQGGGPKFCACFARTTADTLKISDYLVAKVLEKNGLSIKETEAYAKMSSAAYICSSLDDPRR